MAWVRTRFGLTFFDPGFLRFCKLLDRLSGPWRKNACGPTLEAHKSITEAKLEKMVRIDSDIGP